jgi:sugar phosphate isomerase/epimerase
MNAQPALNRREFLASTVLAATAAALPLTLSAADTPAPAPGRPKVGCLSWCFHSLGPAADPEPAIDIIGGLGFDGIELIVTARRDLTDFWTDARIDRLKRKLDGHKLQVSQFVIFQPVVEDLSSTRPEEQARALDYFEAGCRIGQKFAAPIINIVAPWARELKGPSDYLPRFYELDPAAPGQKFHIEIAPGFDWDKVWQAYVATTRACLERAKAHGMKFSIEQHTHCLVPEAASFLRLWDAIRDPALGYNLDAGWTLLQREYPPLAVYKVRGHLMNLHMRDIDGQMRRFPPIGDGVMDFRAIVEAMRQTGFGGFASLEQDKNPGDRDMTETCRRYLRMMREYLG